MKVGPELLTMARGLDLHLSTTEIDPFLEQAVEHRVLGLVRTAVETGRLRAEGQTRLASALAAEELRNQTRWRAVEQSARDAVEALAQAGCQVMVMKGWWSMYALHDRPTDRVTSDVDLLIEPGWRHRRSEVEQVFRPTAPPAEDRTANTGDLDLWSFAFRSIDVDLHRWPMTLPTPMTGHVDRIIWDRYTRPGHRRWAGAREPTRELALAQALVNYSKDRFMQLFQMDDVRRLVSSEELDWDEFHRLTHLAGVERLAAASLTTVCRSLDIEQPPGIAPPSAIFAPWTARRVVLSGRRAPLGPLHVQLLGSLTYGSWRAAMLAIRHRAVPSPDLLPAYLELNRLPDDDNYRRGLTTLFRHRLAQTGRRVLGREDRSGPPGPRHRPTPVMAEVPMRISSPVSVPARSRPSAPTRVIVETASPTAPDIAESLAWSVLVRALVRFLSLRHTVALLDRLPTTSRSSGVVVLPTEPHFGRAGACLGRQLARSQFLRRRGAPSTILIGVRPTGGGPLDAHAWLADLDHHQDHEVIHRVDR